MKPKHNTYKFATRLVKNWKLHFNKIGHNATLLILKKLQGFTLRMATLAYTSLWGFHAEAQNLRFDSQPIDSFDIPKGSKALIDADQDGNLDLLFIQTPGYQLKWKHNIGTNAMPVFDTIAPNPFGLTNSFHNVASGDLNNDGITELVLQYVGDLYIYTIENNQAIGPDTLALPDNINSMYGVQIADIDNDGDNEVHTLFIRASPYDYEFCSSGTYFIEKNLVTYDMHLNWDTNNGFDILQADLTVIIPWGFYFYNSSQVLRGAISYFDFDNDGESDKLTSFATNGNEKQVSELQLSATGDTIRHLGMDQNDYFVYGTIDVDQDGDLDLLGYNKIHLNVLIEPTCPTGTTVLETIKNLDPYCDYSTYCMLEQFDCNSYYSQFSECEVVKFISFKSLAGSVGMSDDVIPKAIRIIETYPGLDQLEIVKKQYGSTLCGYESYYYHTTLSSYDSIYYINSSETTTSHGLFFHNIPDSISLTYQVFDGNQWSPICIYSHSDIYEPPFNTTGFVYFDINNNYIYNHNTDIPAYSAKITNINNGQWTILNSLNYTCPSCQIGDTIKVGFADLSSSPEYHIYGQFSDYPLDFRLPLSSGLLDLSISINQTPVQSGTFTWTKIKAKNYSPELADGVVKVLIPEGLSINLTIPPYDSVINDTLFFNVSNIKLGQDATISIESSVPLPDILPLDSVLVFKSWIVPTDTTIIEDINLTNNEIVISRNVVASYDPNAKYADRGPKLHIDSLLNNDWVYYTIQFQNTGNIYADSVTLIDTFDTRFNLETFELIGNSHLVNVNRAEAHSLQFVFDNIQLADSTSNELESHGYVQFRLRTMQPMLLGDIYGNTAHIYFDFNDAVITEPAVFNIVENEPVNVKNKPKTPHLTVYPNPTHDLLIIKIPSELMTASELTVRDILGKEIMVLPVSGSIAQVPVYYFPSGVYSVILTDEHGVFLTESKFIVE
jgi:FG-GAP-like repeat